MKKVKILFFTPYGGYTGSEMMLWYLLSGINKEKFEVELFAGKEGELLSRFSKEIKVHYSKAHESIFNRLTDKVLKKLGLKGIEERQLLKIHNRFNPGIWYINTMAMSAISGVAVKHNIKYIVHFHELLTQYAAISADDLNGMVKKAYYTVGCSTEVCDNLKTLGAKHIHKQYECVDLSKINHQSNFSSELKSKHQISASGTIVVMSGQRIERKGFDIFVKTALRLKNENYHFLWLGNSKNSGYELYLESLIETHELKNISITAPGQNEYYNYFNLADIFFLTSREDPFPLVMIEAAYLGKPILSFRSGGSEEFVTHDMGMLIDNFSEKKIDAGLAIMKDKINQKQFNNELIKTKAKLYDAKIQTDIFEKWLLSIYTNNS